MEESKKEEKSKINYVDRLKYNAPAIITYIIVLIGMIAVLFIPVFNVNGEKQMLCTQIPAALNSVYASLAGGSLFSIKDSGFFASSFAWDVTYTESLSYAINLSALALVLYCVVAVLGVIFIIPVGINANRYNVKKDGEAYAGKRAKTPRVPNNMMRDAESNEEIVVARKKEKGIVTGWIYAIEILALLCVSLFLFDRLYCIGNAEYEGSLKDDCMIFFCLLGGIWLMFAIQSIYYKSFKGSGVIKNVLFLLSVVGMAGILLCENLEKGAFGNIVSTLENGLNAKEGVVNETTGATIILDVFAHNSWSDVVYLVAAITSLLVIINFFFDITGLATRTNKSGKIFNLVRFGLELIAVVVLAVLIATKAEEYNLGICTYLIIVVAFFQFAISIARMFVAVDAVEPEADYSDMKKYKKLQKEQQKKEKKDKKEQKEQKKQEETEDKINESIDAESLTDDGNSPEQEGSNLQKASDGTPYPSEIISSDSPIARGGFYEGQKNVTPPPVYSRGYDYNNDMFLNTLTPSERAEFFALFIDKIKGQFYFLPEYIIGGDNKEFFQNFFIYLGRFMGVISNGLMNKIYRRLSLLD